MKNTLKLAVAFVVLAVASAFAQTQLTVTTLSSAITSRSTQTINIASTTGLTANGSSVVVDQEVMPVSGLPGGTTVNVIRQTRGAYHAKGAPVVLVPQGALAYALVAQDPVGACARGSSTTTQSTYYLPIINQFTGAFSDCIGGYFVTTTNMLPLNPNPTPILNVSPGDTVYTSVDTNGVALAATTDLYCSTLDLLQGKWLTGIQMLNGTSVATDSRILSLYDASGKLLAKTATLTAGNYGSASEYGGGAFTQLFPAQPGRYWTCAQPVTAAGTASIRMTITQHNDWVLGGIVTITAGSAPASITVPTTFTTAQGPYSAIY